MSNQTDRIVMAEQRTPAGTTARQKVLRLDRLKGYRSHPFSLEAHCEGPIALAHEQRGDFVTCADFELIHQRSQVKFRSDKADITFLQ